MDSIIK